MSLLVRVNLEQIINLKKNQAWQLKCIKFSEF
jgi:hypothetical protein